jgi:hypothetical protein
MVTTKVRNTRAPQPLSFSTRQETNLVLLVVAHLNSPNRQLRALPAAASERILTCDWGNDSKFQKELGEPWRN